MAPQGWGHVLRHPSQAGLGLKEEEPTEWPELVDSNACCCIGIKSGQVSHLNFTLRASIWGIVRWPADGSNSWQPSDSPFLTSALRQGSPGRVHQWHKTATTEL